MGKETEMKRGLISHPKSRKVKREVLTCCDHAGIKVNITGQGNKKENKK